MPAADALTQQFLKLGTRDQRQPCRVGLALENLKPAERATVDRAIRSNNEKLRRGALAWLDQEHGATFSGAALGSHRSGNCTCTSA